MKPVVNLQRLIDQGEISEFDRVPDKTWNRLVAEMKAKNIQWNPRKQEFEAGR